MTPWQFGAVLKARVEERNREQAWLAWHIAGLQRLKKLPDLKEFMGIKKDLAEVSRRLKADLKSHFPSYKKE